jgi:hypothetical protein
MGSVSHVSLYLVGHESNLRRTEMSDYQKGRADAAKGKFDPPSLPLGGLISSKDEVERNSQRKEEYREGFYDKKRELGK